MNTRPGTLPERPRPSAIPDGALPGKIPPHSLEVERAILGTVLMEPGTVARLLEALTVDEFYKDAHRTIYAAMRRLHERGEPADVTILTDELRRTDELDEVGGVAYLATLQEEATTATQFAAYVRTIRDHATKRAAIRLGHALIESGYSGGRADDLRALLDRGRAKLMGAEQNGPAADPRSVPWPVLAPEALHGLAGRIVEGIAPRSEADPAAILLHILVAAGNLLGAGPHARVEQDPHPARLNAVLVGKSSKGRKGTGWSTPRAMLRSVDLNWSIASGLSSGEGVIYHVRDGVTREDPESGETEVLDEGVTDKRLLVVETEFATVLARMARDGNTLSAILRDAWDHGDLRTLTKNSPLRATGAHVSILGHITQEELARLFTDVSMANGFGNRFLWACVRRAHLLPDGEGVDGRSLASLVDELCGVVTTARGFGRMTRDPEASAAWRDVYADLSRERDGLVGALLGRAEAQTLRLSVLYALLDQSPTIQLPHLQAALAVWAYAEASVLYLFGGRLGHPIADAILDALRRASRLTRTEIRDLFGRHKDAAQIEEALRMLERAGLARPGKRETGGRPEEYWEAVWTT